MVRGARSLVPLAALWCGLAAGAELSAGVDRTELLAHEHVLLTLTLRDSDTRLRAEGIEPNVDLSGLAADFDFGPPQAGHRFRIERGQGRATSELTVALFPKRAGRLVIPPFRVAGLATAPIALEVRARDDGAAPEAFARGGVLKQSLWQGEQTVVYLDLYHRIALRSARLGAEPAVDPPQAEIVRLAPQERTEEVAGLSYNVTRSAWALAPLGGSPLTVYLPDVWLETGDGRLRLPPNEVRIPVRPLPAGASSAALVGRPRIEATMPLAAHAETGQTLPWAITLRAQASAARLPESLPGLEFPPGLKAYVDAPQHRVEQDGSGAWSVATYRGVVIPLRPGEFALPEIRVPYFDPDAGAMSAAVLPGRMLAVAPAAAAPDGDPLPPGHRAPTAPAAGADRARYLAPIFAALWLATLALWWRATRARRKRTGRAPAPSRGNGGDPLKARLLDAFGAATLEQGLAQWEARCGIDEALRRTVRAVQHRCYGPPDRPVRDGRLDGEVARAAAQIRSRRSATRAPDA